MRKKTLSLALALAMCLGLTVPAFAAEDETSKHLQSITMTYEVGGHSFTSPSGIGVERAWKMAYEDYYETEEVVVEDFEGYNAVRQDTVFTVTNTAPSSETGFIRVYLTIYEKNSDGMYWDDDYPHESYLTRNGVFLNDAMDPEGLGGLVELKPGESVQFTLPMMYEYGEYNEETGEYESTPLPDADVIYKVRLVKWDMDQAETVVDEWGNSYEEAPTYYKWVVFKVDNSAVDSYLANPEQPTEPVDPAAPAYEVSDWAKERVALAVETGLAPESLGADYRVDITRAQFAAAAVKLYEAMGGQPAQAAGESSFTDTDDPVILQAASLGFVSGTGEGKFEPDALVNREQAAVMLSSVYAKLGGEIPAVEATSFADDGDISGWARSAVAFMNGKGIVTGIGDNSFGPKSGASIEQALLISLKMFETLK